MREFTCDELGDFVLKLAHALGDGVAVLAALDGGDGGVLDGLGDIEVGEPDGEVDGVLEAGGEVEDAADAGGIDGSGTGVDTGW